MSDESEDEISNNTGFRKRNIRISSSESSSTSPSTSSNSPVLTSKRKTNRVFLIDSDSEDSSGSPVLTRKKRKVEYVSSDSEDSSSSSSLDINVMRRANRNFNIIDSDEDQFESCTSSLNENQIEKPSSSKIESDSDEDSEKCPICLVSMFKSSEYGSPESCDHLFCLECILEWSKNRNTCPVDRREFSLIFVRKTLHGKILREITIEKPIPQEAIEQPQDQIFCEICGNGDREDRLLLCDGCDLGFHLDCLTPPLNEVPLGSWFCNECDPEDNFERELDIMEIHLLLQDQEMTVTSAGGGRRARRNNSRLIPRTRQSERVRLTIMNNRSNRREQESDMPSASTTSSTNNNNINTTNSKIKKRKVKRKKRTKRKYKNVYELDEETGDIITRKKLVKKRRKKKKTRNIVQRRPKTVKKRLAQQLGICPLRNPSQILPDVRIQNNNNYNQQALNTQRYNAGIPTLHIFGPRNDLDYFSDNEEIGSGDISGSDYLIRRPIRRIGPRKNIISHLPSSSPTVSSSTTEHLLDSILDAQTKFYSKNTKFTIATDGKLKMEKNGNVDLNDFNKFTKKTPYSGNNKGNENQRHFSGNESTSSTSNGNSYYENYQPSSTSNENYSNSGHDANSEDMPQDYTRSTLSNYEEPKKYDDENDQNSDKNDESDIDIYSDIEDSVSTSKIEPLNLTSTQSGVDLNKTSNSENESDNEMVIDIEKMEQNQEVPTVTSSVDSINCNEPHSTSEVHDKNDDDDDDHDEDSDSEGCPNFSIYSSESINLAKNTDITLDLSDTKTEHNDVVSSTPTSSDKHENEKVNKKNQNTLYSDSEDEMVKISNTFTVGDIRTLTEDVSEEERSYTPCLDEKNPSSSSGKGGLEGLDTEMISDEEKNDFDESNENNNNNKAVSEGDALEINAKESEMELIRPEDYEEGEIVDKNKKGKNPTPINNTAKQSSNNKENEPKEKRETFKKLSKNNKERNYRDKERSKSREKKDRQRKQEKKKEIERYNVRALIAKKPKRMKDRFGRDIRKSRSRSRSYTPPKKSPKRGRSTSRSKRRKRSSSSESRSRSRNRKRINRKSKERTTKKRKLRSKSRTPPPPSALTSKHRKDWNERRWTSSTPEMARLQSPSWTPPRLMESDTRNLTVILQNDQSSIKKKKDKKKKSNKKKDDKRKRKKKETTPPSIVVPSKEVFASGDNILVSVSFNKENETRERDVFTASSSNGTATSTTLPKKSKEQEDLMQLKKKKIKNSKKKANIDLTGVKPMAIIDLDRSPFRELTPSPKDVIVISDEEHTENVARNEETNEPTILCDSSQQTSSPTNLYGGPKTPPEPQVKFILQSKSSFIPINNPLHDPEDEIQIEEEQITKDNSMNDNKGPNTPPESPNSPPSSPDAYDPFEPTKSRSPTPCDREVNVLETGTNEKNDHVPSLTPPLTLDVQPADSQSGSLDVSKSPVQQVTQTVTSVSASMTSSTSTNVVTPRINVLSSTILSNVTSSVSLPRVPTSSPVKNQQQQQQIPQQQLLATKSPVKKLKNSSENDGNLDLDSPYSPGSSDYEDLFEPPPEIVTKKVLTKTAAGPPITKETQQKVKSAFDALFGSPPVNVKKKPSQISNNVGDKIKTSTTNSRKSKGTKVVGVKIDEDNLKILEDLPSSAVELQVKDKFLKKLNRQERVVEEVKLVLKPYYNNKKINKEEYKDIMRRAVPKICHNKSGEINPTRIKDLIEAYVKKIRHAKPKVTSSSSYNPTK